MKGYYYVWFVKETFNSFFGESEISEFNIPICTEEDIL